MVNIPMYTRGEDLERGGSPLRKFTGTFIGSGDDPANPSIFQHTIENRQNPVVDLNFISVKDVTSIVPYSYPTAQLVVNYRTNQQSGKPSDRGGWGLLVQSIKELDYMTASGFHHLPGDDNYGMDDLLSQELVMEMEPNHDYGQREDGQQMSGPVWRVTAVARSSGSSVSGESTEEAAIRILGPNGLDRTAFTEAALEDPVLRGITAVIVDGSFLPGLINSGKIKEEDGLFKVI